MASRINIGARMEAIYPIMIILRKLNKKLYIEIINTGKEIIGETNSYITIKSNGKIARTDNNFKIPNKPFTVEHNNKIYKLNNKIGTYIK